MKELKNKNTEFYTYKPKQGRSFKNYFKVVLKYIHTTANLDDIKKEIEDLGHIVTTLIYGTSRSKTLKRFFICSM